MFDPIKAYLEPVTDSASAMRFLASLAQHGLAYHPDESAKDSLWAHRLDLATLATIDSNMQACHQYLLDPSETLLDLTA